MASVDTMLRGLNWSIEEDVRLINISLSGPYNKILDRAFQRAESNGVIVVAAAGNVGPDQPVQYPAGFSSTLAVTAVDADEMVYENAVRGQSIDFSAPGVDIALHSNTGLQYVTGTSIAAPFVTLRIAADSDISGPSDLSRVRQELARSTRDLGKQGHDETFGYGLITAPPPCRLKTAGGDFATK